MYLFLIICSACHGLTSSISHVFSSVSTSNWSQYSNTKLFCVCSLNLELDSLTLARKVRVPSNDLDNWIIEMNQILVRVNNIYFNWKLLFMLLIKKISPLRLLKFKNKEGPSTKSESKGYMILQKYIIKCWILDWIFQSYYFTAFSHNRHCSPTLHSTLVSLFLIFYLIFFFCWFLYLLLSYRHNIVTSTCQKHGVQVTSVTSITSHNIGGASTHVIACHWNGFFQKTKNTKMEMEWKWVQVQLKFETYKLNLWSIFLVDGYMIVKLKCLRMCQYNTKSVNFYFLWSYLNVPNYGNNFF